jgi:hypothetical protein
MKSAILSREKHQNRISDHHKAVAVLISHTHVWENVKKRRIKQGSQMISENHAAKPVQASGIDIIVFRKEAIPSL